MTMAIITKTKTPATAIATTEDAENKGKKLNDTVEPLNKGHFGYICPQLSLIGSPLSEDEMPVIESADRGQASQTD